jgi:L-rhamnose mutarotase
MITIFPGGEYIMKTLKYSIIINTAIEKVWDTMLNSETYQKWAKAFSPNSQYEGKWEQGSLMKFFDPNLGGTIASLEEVNLYEHIHAKHIAILSKDGIEDRDRETAKKWIGVTESYRFIEDNGVTELLIDINTHEEFASMFDDSWPGSLQLLKNLCEK